MKAIRFFAMALFVTLSMNLMAQNSLTEDATKAQRALMEYLRMNGMAPSIDTRDNSVNFKSNGVLYWVTFDGNSPVLYTMHRLGLKFGEKKDFLPSCARYACNEVNAKHHVKCVYKEKEKSVSFTMSSYAKETSDYHGGFHKVLAAFKDVEKTFDEAYKKAEAQVASVPTIVTTGTSPLEVSYIAFGNFDSAGKMISDYNKPLRKSAMRYVRASIDVSSSEKGIFKIGMRILDPDKKPMVANRNMDYSSTTNIEIKKIKKPTPFDLDQFGSDKPEFWKAGEYKVEIYDFEKGALLYTTSFNIL